MNTGHGDQEAGCELEMDTMGSLQREFMFNKALILVCFSSSSYHRLYSGGSPRVVNGRRCI